MKVTYLLTNRLMLNRDFSLLGLKVDLGRKVNSALSSPTRCCSKSVTVTELSELNCTPGLNFVFCSVVSL